MKRKHRPGVCRGCGCTCDDACVSDLGEPCHWGAADLCSRCAVKIPPAYVRMYVTDSIDRRLPAGWRAFVVAKVGRKWATLVEPANGTRITADVALLDRAVLVDRPRWRKIAAQLRRHAGDDRGLRRLAAELGRAA